MSEAAWLQRRSYPFGHPCAPAGAHSRGRGLWASVLSVARCSAPLGSLLSAVAADFTSFSNLTSVSNETRRIRPPHTRLLSLALNDFKPRLTCTCIMLGRHIAFFQPHDWGLVLIGASFNRHCQRKINSSLFLIRCCLGLHC